MWSRSDVLGLFSNNVGPFSSNVVLSTRYSQGMWSGKSGCFLARVFTFSVHYTCRHPNLIKEPVLAISVCTRTGKDYPEPGFDAPRAWSSAGLRPPGSGSHYSPHSFRATGITNFWRTEERWRRPQRIAGHADSRTRGFGNIGT